MQMIQKKSKLSLVFKSPLRNNFFFGYYDKSPLNKENNKHLALKVKSIYKLPLMGDSCEIGYFDFKKKGEFVKIAKSNIFNWQQGNMLQWLGPDFNTHIIYNELINNKFVSTIYDLKSKKKSHLKNAIYCVAKNGKIALGIDFERHYWFRRGYAYDGVTNRDKSVPVDLNDGIELIDLKKNTKKKIITLRDVIKLKPLKSMSNSTHYFEHLMFSPNGKKFVFYHRWKKFDGSIYTRLYLANKDGSNLVLLHDVGRLSHLNWINDDNLICFGSAFLSIAGFIRKFNSLKVLLNFFLPIYKSIVKGNSTQGNSSLSKIITGDSYFILSLKGKKRKIFTSVLNKDGHPTFIDGYKKKVITDTYPDKKNKVNLILCDYENESIDQVITLESIKSLNDSAQRCDLHPKLSIDGKFISIDTMNDKVRSVYLYEIT